VGASFMVSDSCLCLAPWILLGGCRLMEGFEWSPTGMAALLKACATRLDVEREPSIG